MGSVDEPMITDIGTTKILNHINVQHTAYVNGDKRAREDVIASCFKLIEELEAPGETFMRMVWAQPVQHAALRTGIDLDLFQHISTEDGSPKTSSQLAESTSCDPVLMTRLMRTMAANGLVREVGIDSFVSTAMSKAMTRFVYQDAMKFLYDICMPAYAMIPRYLKETKYQNPVNALDTPMQYLYGGRGEKHTFQYLQEINAMPSLTSLMTVWMSDRTHWSDENIGYYPLSTRLIEGARKSENEVFLVDIGGGSGSDISKLLSLHPQETLPGRLVCQDLPHIIERIPHDFLPTSVLRQGHDFFTPQPIKGARTYFYHSIIHDFPDEAAKNILKQTAAVMEKGYSKLILWDQVVPDTNVDPTVAALDWVMMTFLAGAERSEIQWRKLIEDPEVGLKVTGVWYYSRYDQAVIEAELA